jgi:hypothetical protein
MHLLGTYNTAFTSIVARLTNAGIQSLRTRFLEITAWVLVTAWGVGLAVWLWVRFSPWATIP